MHVPPIGRILRDMGVINDQEIEEILRQQSRTRQKFGLIAMQWGLATPEQVWEAWARQLTMEVRGAQLDDVGTDTGALLRIRPDVIARYRIWPLRLWGRHLVVATTPDYPENILQDLATQLGVTIHRCIVDDEQIERYVQRLASSQWDPDEVADDCFDPAPHDRN